MAWKVGHVGPCLAMVMVVLVLSGCATPAAEREDRAALDVAPELPTAWTFACDDGTSEVAPGVCAHRVTRAGAGLGEPVVARHPVDPHFVAVAAMSTSPPAVAATLPARVVMFVSEDGGKTWRESELPHVADHESHTHIDPTLAIDTSGTIHYSGLLESVTQGGLVFYTRSTDRGASWSEPVVLARDEPGTTDRNWLSLQGDAVFVTWQTFREDSGIAWSLDGGLTWTSTRGPRGCINIGAVTLHGDEFLAGCRGGGKTHILALDLEGGQAVARATIPEECLYPMMAPTPAGSIALVCMDGAWATSGDGGHTWAIQGNILELTRVDDTWPATEVTAVGLDARQGLHLLVTARDATQLGWIADYLPRTVIRIAHVVVDADAAILVQETLLSAPAEQQVEPSAAGVPAPKDDFHGIAITEAGVSLAWTRERAIDVGLAVPAS